MSHALAVPARRVPPAAPRLVASLVMLAIALAPIAGNPALSPAAAHGGELDIVIRLVPAVLGTIAGWSIGSQFGIVGKVLGAYVGFQIGKAVGRFLARTIGGVFHDPYAYQPPLWQRLLGVAGWSRPAYAQPGYGYYPYAPGESLGTLRERWMGAVRDYQDAVKSGSDDRKRSSREALDAAQEASFSARAAAGTPPAR
jgi:hypothetical protein